ncbi:MULTISPECIES: ATP-dependent helicase [Brevundimonas]|uniref:ATP-dependent helicase n=1 Tax=Brevundimonas TaxID=41275 RepID=UPI0019043493|nr:MULTISPECIES: UvrD-helicase domain-containing protein [Brevundimonas]MBK1969349.1 UvrD-helicase domain-containing protein [Brevundimonas diminuta]MBK1975577.1 UvrD-helicase domain-containing protein [Brevundimonas diminuta]MDA0742983.1 UvrD-helicase domain-containing protein [Pseudomonadota bacterium]MDM8352975.1 UvrD-helicase domain-containing protein [Brevundimonas diminuta]
MTDLPAPRISDLARAQAPQGAAADYLSGLNPEQREAVETTEGPVLVLAGAGTGKTRVLTTRLAHILATGRAKPWELLVVTFTNKAAREMRERIGHLIGPSSEGLRWLGTFHSVAAQILRRHAELVGLKSSFTILDTDDQERLLKQLLEAANIDTKRFTPKSLAHMIDHWKNRGWTPDKLPPGEDFANGKGPALYAAYQARLATLNACDFGDLLLHNITILSKHADLAEEYRRRFRYILVDEYQDTNVAQYLWLRLLTSSTGNVCCVGDDDQSIYGWRGAEVDNILRFERDFPGAKVIRLERNYRSTKHILGAASALIAANQDRLGKTLWTEDDSGDKVRVRGVWDGEAEARLIADEIETARKQGMNYKDMAVLVRASFQMRAFEERFLMLAIPYVVIGGPRFFERAEIRDAHAYLRLIQSEDDDLAFERIVNVPKRGIGDTSVQKILHIARENGVSAMRAVRHLITTDELQARTRTPLANFVRDLDRWRDLMAMGTPHWQVMETLLDESGYTAMQKADRTSGQTRLDNLKELTQSMQSFETLQAYLEHVSLVMDLERRDENADGSGSVQIMTLHGAKGLEFPLVFLPGWEEGVFPSQRSIDEKGVKGLEEERRLAYVGVTRAKQDARISFAANRMVYGRWTSQLPSRFVDELPLAHVEPQSDTGYYGASTGMKEAKSRWDDAPSFGGGYSSPGWKRAQTYTAAQTPKPAYARHAVIEGEGRLIATADPKAASGWSRGDRVFHQKFGYGSVRAVEGNKLVVSFDKAGEKKVIDTFVEKAP